MAPFQVAAAIKLRLAEELVEDLRAIEQLATAVASLIAPAQDARGEWMRVRALAFEIERYYTGVEAVLVRSLRTLDGDVPTGAAWHLEILRAAGVQIPGGRPALISPEAADPLRELLKFRHLARHGYESEPKLALMEAHARRVAEAHRAFVGSMGEVDRWLRQA
jgi:hypothetical protein